ncbi:hypothetical protein MTR_2g027020 [Medicago truncatula]|uniref:RNase H type-1 domain-containing protein n=1 Tax=Medicago truncatula TaxID=3880 RepID=G7IQ12_MEDTR|nr:hypothetical protein MTR_2g027020 [Medicago truncatula]
MSVGYRWKKLIYGRLKCSIDLCFSASTNKLGICTCIRDEEGCFVLAKSMWFTLLCSIDVGEALGLYHAIKWIHDLRLPNVDSKRVVDYFNRSNDDITEYGIIMDINIYYCSLYLTNSRVGFTRRQANEVVHELTNASTSLLSSRIFDDLPTCINNLIANEMYKHIFLKKSEAPHHHSYGSTKYKKLNK